MKFKRLSFYDYNEEKTNLLEFNLFDSKGMKGDADYLKAKSETETENSDMSSLSSMQSVDEGAVAMLSMDQIRNMR